MAELGRVAVEELREGLGVPEAEHLRHAAHQVLLEVGLAAPDGDQGAGHGEVVLAEQRSEALSHGVVVHRGGLPLCRLVQVMYYSFPLSSVRGGPMLRAHDDAGCPPSPPRRPPGAHGYERSAPGGRGAQRPGARDDAEAGKDVPARERRPAARLRRGAALEGWRDTCRARGGVPPDRAPRRRACLAPRRGRRGRGRGRARVAVDAKPAGAVRVRLDRVVRVRGGEDVGIAFEGEVRAGDACDHDARGPQPPARPLPRRERRRHQPEAAGSGHRRNDCRSRLGALGRTATPKAPLIRLSNPVVGTWGESHVEQAYQTARKRRTKKDQQIETRNWKMNKQLRTIALVGLTLAATAAPSTLPQWGDGTAEAAGKAETRSMSVREFNRLIDLLETDAESYAWGREMRPVMSEVVILNPPLPKVGPRDKVTVEWFFSPIDERSGTTAWQRGMFAMYKWRDSIDEAEEDRIEIMPQPVSSGPGVPPRFEQGLKVVQDMLYSWGENPWRGTGAKVYAKLVVTRTYLGTITEEDARKIIEQAGLDSSIWMAKRKLSNAVERRERANSRYQEAMRQAIEKNRRYLNTPQDPVLLIDGRYLLTGYATKRTRKLFRMANWIVQRELEKIPTRP